MWFTLYLFWTEFSPDKNVLKCRNQTPLIFVLALGPFLIKFTAYIEQTFIEWPLVTKHFCLYWEYRKVTGR